MWGADCVAGGSSVLPGIGSPRIRPREAPSLAGLPLPASNDGDRVARARNKVWSLTCSETAAASAPWGMSAGQPSGFASCWARLPQPSVTSTSPESNVYFMLLGRTEVHRQDALQRQVAILLHWPLACTGSRSRLLGAWATAGAPSLPRPHPSARPVPTANW